MSIIRCTGCLLVISIVLFGTSLCTAQDDKGKLDLKEVKRLVAAESASGDSAPAHSAATGGEEESENLILVILRITGYLVLIVVLIFAIAWLVRKGGFAGGSKIGGGSMDILEVLHLGTNRSLLMVRVMDQVILLGQTQNTINVLDKIEGPQALEIISSSKRGVSINGFKDTLENFVGKMGKKSS
ncbi:MAG: hypothetical protein GF401_10465 [Chitinivibrionales bacterium]|nr:hypothetical protein [Chitinivibrionales bacterium]